MAERRRESTRPQKEICLAAYFSRPMAIDEKIVASFQSLSVALTSVASRQRRKHEHQKKEMSTLMVGSIRILIVLEKRREVREN